MELQEDDDRLIVIEKNTKHSIIFNVKNLPPKMAVTLRNFMIYQVPTLKSELVTIFPETNTILDSQQWANLMSQITIDSRHANEFNYANQCNCEAGCRNCQALLQLRVSNTSDSEELSVYSDDIVSSDPRVMPIYRSFTVVSMMQTEKGIGIETDGPHTFDDGDLVTVLNVPGLPRFMKALYCTKTTLILVDLNLNKSEKTTFISTATTKSSLGRITKRQLIYVLGPKETIALDIIARKGFGEDHIKWSPIAEKCFYRPLFRGLKLDGKLAYSLTPEQRQDFVKTCPKDVFDIEDYGVEIRRPDNCDACRRCERWGEANNMPDLARLPLNKLPKWQQFTVITNGSIDAASVVSQGLDIMKEHLIGGKPLQDEFIVPTSVQPQVPVSHNIAPNVAATGPGKTHEQQWKDLTRKKKTLTTRTKK